ncbi:hypothetical protein [Hypericibacter sp.]|uniref:hypothetical protein n=1 Tax=Hypericibacter sp. TaxID=2705401 RepID=UPI003D6C8D7C
MLTRDEVLHGAYGAWRLLLGDRRGLEWIDRSPMGAWRSFLLAPLLFPLDLINIGIAAQLFHSTAPWFQIVIVDLVIYAISWAVYPLLMLGLAPMLGREREMLGYIAVTNWCSVILSLLFTVLSLLLWIGIIPDLPATLLTFVLMAVQLVYGGFVARTALNVSLPLAAALSVAQLVLSFILSQITFALI